MLVPTDDTVGGGEEVSAMSAMILVLPVRRTRG
ncbi:hypothetical protein EV650_4440 [Kribbella kalugense]|uniref:Uncharacterized protein n=1 Tax=Kribbella kalugense TaxID=2512221 RepID=A0A4R7ZK76_9ACTN|nr:hypothetical protein EV650_4440 [Kribbella kalugense]